MRDELSIRPIDRTDRLGSAHAGARDWRIERLSSLGLAPLSLWFLAAFALHARAGYRNCLAWLREPLSAVAMLLLILLLFRHLELGLRAVIEDYVHSAAKALALILIRLLCLVLVVVGVVAELRILLGR